VVFARGDFEIFVNSARGNGVVGGTGALGCWIPGGLSDDTGAFEG